MADDAQPVCYETAGHVARITINREARRNALSNPTIAALEAAFALAAADADVRAIVLTGAGDRAFCAGGDLSGGTGIFSAGGAQTTLPLANLLRRVRMVEQPIVARVNGACMAGGMALLAMADLAVAAQHARFGLPEARIGIFPMQVIAGLQHLIRPRDLAELCLCAEPIDAEAACAMGLVNRVAPAGALDETVDAMLERLLAGAPSAMRRGKYALASMADMTADQALRFAEGQVGLQAATDDAREGVAAFQEKRQPVWSGR